MGCDDARIPAAGSEFVDPRVDGDNIGSAIIKERRKRQWAQARLSARKRRVAFPFRSVHFYFRARGASLSLGKHYRTASAAF